MMGSKVYNDNGDVTMVVQTVMVKERWEMKNNMGENQEEEEVGKVTTSPDDVTKGFCRGMAFGDICVACCATTCCSILTGSLGSLSDNGGHLWEEKR